MTLPLQGTPMTQELTVEQCDIALVNDWIESGWCNSYYHLAAFARHRTEALAASDKGEVQVDLYYEALTTIEEAGRTVMTEDEPGSLIGNLAECNRARAAKLRELFVPRALFDDLRRSYDLDFNENDHLQAQVMKLRGALEQARTAFECFKIWEAPWGPENSDRIHDNSARLIKVIDEALSSLPQGEEG